MRPRLLGMSGVYSVLETETARVSTTVGVGNVVTNPHPDSESNGADVLAARVRQLYGAIEASTALPTTEQRQLTRLSHEKLMEQIERVNQLKARKLPALEKQLDEAGVPWTPGRPIQ